MARKVRHIYEVLVNQARGLAEKRPGAPAIKSRAPGGSQRVRPAAAQAARNPGGFGDRRLEFSVTLNALVGVLLAVVVVLAGTYALGRFHGGGGREELDLSAPGPAPRPGVAKPEEPGARAALQRQPGLCVIFYKGDKSREYADRMASWLQERGLPASGVLVQEQGNEKGWLVAVPIGAEGEAGLKQRLAALPAPEFDRRFSFAEQVKEMSRITLGVPR